MSRRVDCPSILKRIDKSAISLHKEESRLRTKSWRNKKREKVKCVCVCVCVCGGAVPINSLRGSGARKAVHDSSSCDDYIRQRGVLKGLVGEHRMVHKHAKIL